MSSRSTTYRSGELARLAGVSSDTLRYYERNGLLRLPQRTAAGYRVYSSEAFDRVQLIRSAIAIEFSVRELAQILDERDKGKAPCRKVHALATQKLSELDAQLNEIKALRKRLDSILKDWQRKLKKTPHDHQARLLDSIRPRKTRRTP